MVKMFEFWGMSEVVPLASNVRWPEQVGIELEVENCNVREGFGSWSVHDDPSLRDGTEFVLRRPCAGNALSNALTQFYGLKMQYNAGARTSTHIHVNARDLTFDGIRTMLMVMYTIEDAVFSLVGESRKWASYAMPLSEMNPQRLRTLMTADTDKQRTALINAVVPAKNQERYYGFNVAALKRHGTVEFRYFPGGPSREELEDWLDLVTAVKKIGRDFSPSEMLEMIQTPDQLAGFLEKHIPTHAQRIMNASNPGTMLSKFEEIAAQYADPDGLERRDQLHYRNDLFTQFLMTTVLFTPEAQAYMRDVLKQFDVLTHPDWIYYLRRALELNVKEKAARKKPQLDEPQPAGRNPFRAEIAQAVEHDPQRDEYLERLRQAERQLRANAEAAAARRPDAGRTVRVHRVLGETDNEYIQRILRANNQ